MPYVRWLSIFFRNEIFTVHFELSKFQFSNFFSSEKCTNSNKKINLLNKFFFLTLLSYEEDWVAFYFESILRDLCY